MRGRKKLSDESLRDMLKCARTLKKRYQDIAHILEGALDEIVEYGGKHGSVPKSEIERIGEAAARKLERVRGGEALDDGRGAGGQAPGEVRSERRAAVGQDAEGGTGEAGGRQA